LPAAFRKPRAASKQAAELSLASETRPFARICVPRPALDRLTGIIFNATAIAGFVSRVPPSRPKALTIHQSKVKLSGCISRDCCSFAQARGRFDSPLRPPRSTK
jgi:hypothetical protein